MSINVTVIRKRTGDLEATGFQNEAQMVETFFETLHFNNPETQLKWLEDLRDNILPGSILDFKNDFDLDTDREKPAEKLGQLHELLLTMTIKEILGAAHIVAMVRNDHVMDNGIAALIEKL